MPQGKGTYGSQVGRPPKKQKKYQAGGNVDMNADPFSTKNAFGVPAGEALKEMNRQNIKEGLKEAGKASQPPQGAPPTANAQERSQTFQVGGKVLEYKEGGKVRPEHAEFEKIRKQYEKGKSGSQAQSSKQKEEHRIAAEEAKKRHLKQQSEYGKGMGISKPKKKKKKKWEGRA